MYQETNGGNATKKQDLLLFFGLLLYRLRHGRKAVRLDKATKKTGGAA